MPGSKTENLPSLRSDDLDWPLISVASVAAKLPEGSALLRGVLGSLFRSSSVPVIHADFDAMVIPGLRSLGVEAAVIAMPERLEALPPIDGRLGTPIFNFAGEPFPEEVEERETDGTPDVETILQSVREDRNRTLEHSGLLLRIGDEQAAWQDENGQTVSAPYDRFREQFTRMVRWQGGSRPGSRRAVFRGAALRSALYAAAFPDRFVTAGPADALRRQEGAEFLLEAAGRLRDPVSLRWRQAGALLAEGKVDDALGRLYDAAVRGLDLPRPMQEALALPEDAPLRETQIRELIYLARAAGRDLKVFAARRLGSENRRVVVRQTLMQLALSADPIVRGAAAAALGKSQPQ